MPQQRSLETGSPWVELSTTPDDWKAADPVLLGTMLAEKFIAIVFSRVQTWWAAQAAPSEAQHQVAIEGHLEVLAALPGVDWGELEDALEAIFA